MDLFPTSMVWAPVLEVQRMKSSMLSFRNLYTSKRRSRTFQLLRLGRPVSIPILRKHLRIFATRLTKMEQNFSTLTARMCKVETYAASASNVSGSARSWPSGEQVDGSTAARSHGPGSSDDNRNCKDNTSNDPFYRCKSVQEFGYRWNWPSQNTVWLQVHKWTTKIQKDRTLHLVLRLRGETERQDARHQWQRDHQDWSTFHTAHMNHNTWLMHTWSHERIVQ